MLGLFRLSIILTLVAHLVPLPPPGPTKEELAYDVWYAARQAELHDGSVAILATWDNDHNGPPDLVNTVATIEAAKRTTAPHAVPLRKRVSDVLLMGIASVCRSGAELYQSTDQEGVKRLRAVALLITCAMQTE